MRPYQNVKGMLVAVVVCVALGLMAQPAPAYVIQILDQSYSCNAWAGYYSDDYSWSSSQKGETSASVSNPKAGANASISPLWGRNQSGYTDYMQVEFTAEGYYSGGDYDSGRAGSGVEISGEFSLMVIKSKGDVEESLTIPCQTFYKGGGFDRSLTFTMNNKNIWVSGAPGEITLPVGLNTFSIRYYDSIGSGGTWMGYEYEARGFIGFWPEGIYLTSELPPAAPLPGTILFLGTGLAGLALQRWRRRPGKD